MQNLTLQLTIFLVVLGQCATNISPVRNLLCIQTTQLSSSSSTIGFSVVLTLSKFAPIEFELDED
uniref:Uncharacterized protein n=1 Tax=Romanomermis culicivorax TaxID=13658 RepID=A0A915ICG0_ROMCU